MADAYRSESDSMGNILVPHSHLWGAQTERSRLHFAISSERFSTDFIHALCIVKKAAAITNSKLGVLNTEKANAIIKAADEVLSGAHPDEFPLSIWQTGSGTQTNMNMNEVLANRASELLGGERGKNRKVHPNDDVNRSQSSNDVFPSAMNISAALAFRSRLRPCLETLLATLRGKATEFKSIIKVGRTHLMDATPLTLGQEFSGYASQIEHALQHLESALPHLSELALGGTAVGTGLNAPPGFGLKASEEISQMTRHPFISAPNKFEAVATHDSLVYFHGAIKGLAVSLNKIANDIRWMASGPQCAIGEIELPENEPGSSIMPGKINPTQCEALIMGCTLVFGNDVNIGIAASSGNFELNTGKPLIIHCLLQSITVLSDCTRSFTTYCLRGIRPRTERIEQHLKHSLMLVTALAPHIGYDACAKIAQLAHLESIPLKDAATRLKLVTPDDFDEWVAPRRMIGE